MHLVGLNLIQLSAIGLLYRDVLVSNRVPGVNDPELTAKWQVTMAMTAHSFAPARYLPVTNVGNDIRHQSYISHKWLDQIYRCQASHKVTA